MAGRIHGVGHDQAFAARFHPDGETLISAGRDGRLIRWRIADAVEVESYEDASPGSSLARLRLSTAGDVVMTHFYDSDETVHLTVRSLPGGKVLQRLVVKSSAPALVSAATSPDGTLLAVVDGLVPPAK